MQLLHAEAPLAVSRDAHIFVVDVRPPVGPTLGEFQVGDPPEAADLPAEARPVGGALEVVHALVARQVQFDEGVGLLVEDAHARVREGLGACSLEHAVHPERHFARERVQRHFQGVARVEVSVHELASLLGVG